MKPEYSTTTTNYASCRWCGIVAGSVPHTIEACPSVKAVEYHPDGSIARVEKWGPVDRQAPVIPLWWFSTHLEAMGQYPLVPAHNPYATTEESEDEPTEDDVEDDVDGSDVDGDDEIADGFDEETDEEELTDEVPDDEELTDVEEPSASRAEPREPGPVTFAQVPAAEGLDAVVHKRSDYVAPPNSEPSED
jgi:hypothetical protein